MKRIQCDSCQIVRINGVICHETGCPNAWKNAQRECPWCGRAFKPKERRQKCCSMGCTRSYRS